MAQAKKKQATRTRKAVQKRATGSRANVRTHKQAQQQGSNVFFVVSMSVLAATLLFADLVMITM